MSERADKLSESAMVACAEVDGWVAFDRFRLLIFHECEA